MVYAKILSYRHDGSVRGKLVKEERFSDYNATMRHVENRWEPTGTWGWEEWAKTYIDPEVEWCIVQTSGPRGVSHLTLFQTTESAK